MAAIIAHEDDRLGLGPRITRRDLVNGALAGSGAMLAVGHTAQAASAPDLFTGYAGIGDYAASNGNTLPVMQAAHGV